MTKYRFWVTSSRMTNKEEIVELPDDMTDEEDIKGELEDWCSRVFPMFHFTDAFVSYGFDKVEETSP